MMSVTFAVSHVYFDTALYGGEKSTREVTKLIDDILRSQIVRHSNYLHCAFAWPQLHLLLGDNSLYILSRISKKPFGEEILRFSQIVTC